MSEHYVVGDSINIPAVFEVLVAGVLTATDPTAVTLVVTDPAGTANTYNWPSPATLTHVGTGSFNKVIVASLAGVYSYVYTGTGTAAGVQSGTVTVFPVDPINTSYCTLDELKTYVFSGGQTPDDNDDMLMQMAVESTSRWIDGYCHRHFYKTTTTRTFQPLWGYDAVDVTTGDIVSVTALKTDANGDGTYENTWAASDYQLLPLNAASGFEPRPYWKIRAVANQQFPYLTIARARRDLVQIDGVFGWPAVPTPVRQACLVQSARVYMRNKSPEGFLSGADQFGQMRVGTRLDPDVEMMLSDYRLMSF